MHTGLRLGEIDTRINEGKRFNFLENKFIEAITDKHPLNGREIAGKPPYILLYPDVKKMPGISSPESFYETDLLFHVMAACLHLIFHHILSYQERDHVFKLFRRVFYRVIKVVAHVRFR